MTKQRPSFGLKTEEQNLIARVRDSIDAGDSYFLVFCTAFGGLMNMSPGKRDALTQKPVYQILESIVETYRADPRAYKR